MPRGGSAERASGSRVTRAPRREPSCGSSSSLMAPILSGRCQLQPHFGCAGQARSRIVRSGGRELQGGARDLRRSPPAGSRGPATAATAAAQAPTAAAGRAGVRLQLGEQASAIAGPCRAGSDRCSARSRYGRAGRAGRPVRRDPAIRTTRCGCVAADQVVGDGPVALRGRRRPAIVEVRSADRLRFRPVAHGSSRGPTSSANRAGERLACCGAGDRPARSGRTGTAATSPESSRSSASRRPITPAPTSRTRSDGTRWAVARLASSTQPGLGTDPQCVLDLGRRPGRAPARSPSDRRQAVEPSRRLQQLDPAEPPEDQRRRRLESDLDLVGIASDDGCRSRVGRTAARGSGHRATVGPCGGFDGVATGLCRTSTPVMIRRRPRCSGRGRTAPEPPSRHTVGLRYVLSRRW